MENLQVGVVFRGGDTTTECSDVHIRMIHLRQANKRETDLLAFRQLQSEDLFTDMTLVLKGGRKLSVHSLVVAANSKYLKPWMETTFVPDLNYTIILPDVEYGIAQALCQILYGLDLSMSQTQFSKIHQLAEFLGITMDIKHGESVAPESTWSSPQNTAPARPLSKLPEKRINEPVLPTKVPSKTTRKTLARIAPKAVTNSEGQPPILVPNIAPSPNKVHNLAPGIPTSLPICCWHCNQSFPHLDDLQKHLKTHKGEQTKSSTKHKCQKCKKILPSMWKLRQHLLTHKAATLNRTLDRRDHQYAEPSPVATSDHMYASSTTAETPTIAATVSTQLQSSSAQSSLTDHAYNSRPQEEPSTFEIEQPIIPLNPDRYDHLYSSRKQIKTLTPKVVREPPPEPKAVEPASIAIQMSENIVATPADHAYSSSVTNIEASHSRDVSVTSLKSPPKRMKPVNTSVNTPPPLQRTSSRTVSFQALGHSYAAKLEPPKNEEAHTSKKKPGSSSSPKVRSFPCDQCDRIFPQLYRRTRHIREVHDKERKHICRFCDKSFFKVTSLQRHELIHAVHAKWKCPNENCSKTFTDQSALKYHVDHQVCSKVKKRRLQTK